MSSAQYTSLRDNYGDGLLEQGIALSLAEMTRLRLYITRQAPESASLNFNFQMVYPTVLHTCRPPVLPAGRGSADELGAAGLSPASCGARPGSQPGHRTLEHHAGFIVRRQRRRRLAIGSADEVPGRRQAGDRVQSRSTPC